MIRPAFFGERIKRGTGKRIGIWYIMVVIAICGKMPIRSGIFSEVAEWLKAAV
jgi:hypothetical protein